MTPRAVLTVRWGPLDAQRAVIEPGATLCVGRTSPAGLIVAHDVQMSGAHFELTWDGERGHLRDRKSAGGTYLDGQKVSEGKVANGAWIRAGDTVFVFHVEGATAAPPRNDTPEVEAQKAAALAALRAEPEPLFAVLDAARDPRVLELLRESVEEHASLYEGTQGQLMAEAAPYLVRLEGPGLLERLVLEGWGESWGIYLASKRPFKEVRRQLRRVLMVEVEGVAPKVYFRFYDPRVLRLFLPTCTVRQAEEMFSGASRFMVEGEGGELLGFPS